MTAVVPFSPGRRPAGAHLSAAPFADEEPVELDPLDLYAAGLGGAALYLRHSDGWRVPVPTQYWTGGLQPGDEDLLARCLGPTLDVGCGPGRLTAALQRRGQPALGIDLSDAALRIARGAGAHVLSRDVFAAVPGAGRWERLLLADGNLGIGGDPVRLLGRCRELIAPGGLVLVELSRTTGSLARTNEQRPGPVRLEDAHGRVSAWFPWATLGAAEIRRVANAAGLRIAATWSAAGRPFAALGRDVVDETASVALA
jgi:SAM-dependent methyltransferase